MKLITKALQKRFAEVGSSSELIMLPESGHYIQYDSPDVVIEAVRNVVERVRDGSTSH